MKQNSFAQLEYDSKKKVTRKERFLQQMDEIIPWKRLLKPLRKHYPKAGGGRPLMPIGVPPKK